MLRLSTIWPFYSTLSTMIFPASNTAYLRIFCVHICLGKDRGTTTSNFTRRGLAWALARSDLLNFCRYGKSLFRVSLREEPIYPKSFIP
jgi:hypothetical protein